MALGNSDCCGFMDIVVSCVYGAEVVVVVVVGRRAVIKISGNSQAFRHAPPSLSTTRQGSNHSVASVSLSGTI